VIESFWHEAEEQTERLLLQHAAEVEAVAEALLKKGDLTGKECTEIIAQTAAGTPVIGEDVPLLQHAAADDRQVAPLDQVSVEASEQIPGSD
jgi:hypothetical protein